MNLKKKIKHTYVAVFLLCAAGVVGYCLWVNIFGATHESADEKRGAKPTKVIEIDEGTLPKKNGESAQKDGYTITREDAPAPKGAGASNTDVPSVKIPTPALGAVPQKTLHMPLESYNLASAKLIELKADIYTAEKTGKQTSNEVWLDTALYYNMLGDTQTARTIWLYLTKSSPGLFQSYGNLANQYMAEKNWPLAEAWYTKAIALKRDYLQYYQDLSDVYIAEKKTEAAVRTLEQGIAADTHSWSLCVALGRHFNTIGNIKKAHEVFNMGIERAKKAGDTAAAEAIEKEKIYTQ
jgi:tetratricopeptide (TPR) repeat protein